MARSQEVRRQRKKQRREDRKRNPSSPRSAGGWVDEDPVIVMVPTGHGAPAPSEIALPVTRLSDSLVELMEPYIPSPWSKDELDRVERWLVLVAQVWNLTVVDDPMERDRTVARIARLAPVVDIDAADVPSLIETIAIRKRRLFAADIRKVLSVELAEEDGCSVVRAAGAWYTR